MRMYYFSLKKLYSCKLVTSLSINVSIGLFTSSNRQTFTTIVLLQVSNLFIMSLAAADLTVGVIVMPISAAYAMMGKAVMD